MLKNRPYVFLRNYITGHPRYGKVKYWTKLISVTGFAQILVQVIGFICGILVIRLLPVEEYALYTIANTMLGTMTVLSDGGVSTGVLAQGGKVWQDKARLGAVLATGLDLRRKFAGFSLLVSIPILCYLLLHHGASVVTTVLISVSLIPAFYAGLSDVLLQIPVKLHQAIVPLQRNQVEVSIGRLALTGITLFAFPWAFVAIIMSGIPRIVGNIRLRKISNIYADKGRQIDFAEKKEILKIVKRIMPGAIYYCCFSGQITIWLLSILGTTTSVAQLGALGRLSTVLTVFSALFSTLVFPNFAKLKNNKNTLLRRVVILIIVIVLCSLSIVGLICIFSNQILTLLGSSYTGLNQELFLSIVVSCISMMGGFFFGLGVSKGWTVNPILLIVGNFIFIIMGILLFDISTLFGVLIFNLLVAIYPILIHGFYLFYKISKLN